MILDFSDINDTSSRVLDNNFDTFYNSEERSNALLFVSLDAVYIVKWILISIRVGNNILYIFKTINNLKKCWITLYNV